MERPQWERSREVGEKDDDDGEPANELLGLMDSS